jgi:hypothetical protein
MYVLPGVLGPSFGLAQDKLTPGRIVAVRLGFDFGFQHLFFGSHELFSKFSIRIPQSAFRNRRPGVYFW